MLFRYCWKAVVCGFLVELFTFMIPLAILANPQADSVSPAETNVQVSNQPNNAPKNLSGNTSDLLKTNRQAANLSAADEVSPLVFKLEYVKPEPVKSMLAALFPDNRIRSEIINNMLVVVGSEEDLVKVKDMLAKIDIAPKQVIFEAEAIEVSRDDVRNIGIDWGPITALPGVAAVDGSSVHIGLGVLKQTEYGVNVSATLHRLVENKKGRLLASPRIAALDGQTAQILIGDKLAVESTQISNGTTVTSVTYVEVGIKLEVTPAIHEDGTITTHIKPEVSNKTDTTTSGNPNIRTRQAETTLRVRNGETIVIGGLLQRQETKDMIKFPLLGDIPLIGQFFRSTTKEKTESELIILITPKLIDL